MEFSDAQKIIGRVAEGATTVDPADVSHALCVFLLGSGLLAAEVNESSVLDASRALISSVNAS